MVSLLRFEELHAGIIQEFVALREMLNTSPHGTLFTERNHLGALEQRVVDFWRALSQHLAADQSDARAMEESCDELKAALDELEDSYKVAAENNVEARRQILDLEEEIDRLKARAASVD